MELENYEIIYIFIYLLIIIIYYYIYIFIYYLELCIFEKAFSIETGF